MSTAQTVVDICQSAAIIVLAAALILTNRAFTKHVREGWK